MRKLGLIAGGGSLPIELAECCERAGRPCFVIRISGFATPALASFPGVEVPLGALGRMIEALQAAGCGVVCFAGTVRRPDFTALEPDAKGMAALPRIVAAAREGDATLLRAILGVFEDEGFGIEGAQDVMRSLTLAAGALGRHAPGSQARADLEKALRIADQVGRMDAGQGAVVCEGLVLALEAQEGTDAMLQRVAELPRELRGAPGAPRGVLAKVPKPIQDGRIDLPVIGVRTIELAAAAGLAGIAGRAGGLIVLDRPALIASADGLGLFVWGEEQAR